MIREREREIDSERKRGGEKMPRQTNGKSPGRPLWDRQHNCGVEWEEWGYPHNILPRARPYSIDQPGVYTSNSTLYFIRNCPKW